MNWLTTGAKALAQMFHPSRPAMWGTRLTGSRFDYRRAVGDCLDTSVVTAPVQWLQRALPEARLAVSRRKRGGGIDELTDHAMLALIQNPNPFYGDIALWAGTILSYAIAGNAYWLKVRNGAGRPAELWYVPHWTMRPEASRDGSEFLSHYRYSPGGGIAPMRIEIEDVVHFRHGIDPRDPRLGLSPIDGVIREIFMDLEASNFVASLLRNMGVPGVVISPKGGAMPAPEDVAATKSWFQEQFGGDRRGGVLVMGAPTDVAPYGFNPQQMNMSESRDVAEERVCACLGIPAAVVGFGAGLQTAKVGATMEELRKIAWHNGVLPLGRSLADELKRSLLPDFDTTPGLQLFWDTSDVPALQEDEDKRAERLGKMLASGAITVHTYKTELGMEATDADRIYLRQISVIEVPEGQPARIEPPVPALPAPKGRWEKAARASEAGYKRGVAYALQLQRQERGLSAAFEKRLKDRFAAWRVDAHAAATAELKAAEPKAEKDDGAIVAAIIKRLGLPAWTAQLTDAFRAHYLEVAKATQDAAERAGLGANLPDPVARAIVAAGGRRVGLIDLDQQTREAVFDALAEGRSEGEGVEQLAARIAGHIEGGPWNAGEIRARIIARTETKFAQNVSTIERAKAAGVAKFVVFDGRLGPGRSLPDHIARDGSIVTAEEADTMAAEEHPNGTLSFAPYFEE